MARTFKLVWSGTDVDLLDTSGFIATRGGFGGTRFRTRMDLIGGLEGSENQLRSTRVAPIIEKYRLNLLGSSHDDAAANMQALHQALLEAEKYHTTDWQINPVYLQTQTTNETNARYALVYGSPQLITPDFFDQPFESSNELGYVDVQITREPYWRSGAPGTLQTDINLQGAEFPGADGPEQFVGMAYIEHAFDHIYIDNGGAFGSNLVGTNDYYLLPLSPVADDAIYFGSDNYPFFSVLFDLSELSSGISGVWEIWTGAAWSDIVETSGLDGTFDFSGYDGETGQYAIYLGNVKDWAQTAVNGATDYWLRYRITNVSSPVRPKQSANQTIGPGHNNSIIVEATAIDGDMDALARIWFSRKADPSAVGTLEPLGEIICGMKTRNLTSNNKSSYLPIGPDGGAGIGVQGGWTGAVGTDTAEFTNENAPQSTIAKCTFATVATEAIRWTSTCADSAAENWNGSWQVYLLAYQTLGSAKDVEVELEWNVNQLDNIFNGFVPLQGVETDEFSETPEVINLGRIDLPPTGRTRTLAEGQAPNLTEIEFQVRALSNNGSTPNLHLCALVLIPIDEMAFRLTKPDVSPGTEVFSMTPERAVVLDGGLVGEGVELLSEGSTELTAMDTHAIQWMLRSELPKLPPDKLIYLYCLPINSRDPSASDVILTNLHSGFYARVWTHERWHTLRGAD